MRQDLDLEAVHGNNVRRSSCTRLAILESIRHLLVVVGYKDANTKSAKDKEGCKTVEDGVEGSRHDLSRVFGFTSSHGDVVGSSNGEGSQNQALQETQPFTQCSVVMCCRDRSWILPVCEAERIMLWITSAHGDESEEDEPDNQENLSEGGPELGLTVPLYGQQVDKGVQDDGNGDDDSSRYNITPEVDNDITGGNFERYHGSFKDEEVPTTSKAKGFIDITTSEPNKGRRDRQVSNHFSHAQRNGENDGTPEGEGEEQAQRPTSNETFSDLDL